MREKDGRKDSLVFLDANRVGLAGKRIEMKQRQLSNSCLPRDFRDWSQTAVPGLLGELPMFVGKVTFMQEDVDTLNEFDVLGIQARCGIRMMSTSPPTRRGLGRGPRAVAAALGVVGPTA